MRVAQIAVALGADLGRLDHVPDAVEAVLDAAGPGVGPPERLLEFVGAGPNQWTAAEGALKVRETAYVAAEGHSVEQLLHGPSVALREGDALVALNGGGPGEGRLLEIARLAEACGARVHTIAATYPSELLSIFPLTTAVQRIALDCAETLGTNPDSFGRDLPGPGRGARRDRALAAALHADQRDQVGGAAGGAELGIRARILAARQLHHDRHENDRDEHDARERGGSEVDVASALVPRRAAHDLDGAASAIEQPQGSQRRPP